MWHLGSPCWMPVPYPRHVRRNKSDMSASNSSLAVQACESEKRSTHRAAAAPSPAPIAFRKPMNASAYAAV